MLRLFISLCIALCAVLPAHAEDYTIAAIVNDDIISMLDVEERVRFVMVTTGLSDTPETKKRLLPQIVRALIDERLQLQAARENGVKVNDKELGGAIADIEQQRGKPAGSLLAYLKEQGVNPETFTDQIESQIAWNKLISRRVGGRVAVSSEEIARELEQRKRQKSAREEALITGFVLPVGKPEDEQKVRALADKLETEIAGGASFDAVASQLTSARGQLSNAWVDLASLDPLIAKAIRAQTGPGVLAPVRTAAGYHLIRLSDKREVRNLEDAEVLFKVLKLSLDSSSTKEDVDLLMSIARDVAKNPGKCQQRNIAGISSFEGLNIDIDYTRTSLSKLSPEILPLVKDLRLEQVSEPFATPKGLNLMMLCEKVVTQSAVQDKEKIRDDVLRQKVELEAMRYLRDLRREAFVEVKL